MTTGKYNRLPIFIPTAGLASAILLSINFALVFVIGYAAVYTSILTTFVTMYLLIKLYKHFIKIDLTIIMGLLISLPIFFIDVLLIEGLSHIDFKGTRTYSYYADNYILHVIERSLPQVIVTSLFFAFIFLPLYRLIRKRRTLNKTHQD